MSTVHTRIETLRNALRLLVNHFNKHGEWDAALRAQTALVQVDNILGAGDVDLEAEVHS